MGVEREDSMATADSGIIAQKSSKNLRFKLLVVQAVVFVIPFLIISYIFNKNSVTLDSSQMIIIAFILVLILAGLMMLRQIFERFFSMASIVKNAMGRDESASVFQKDTDELHEITVSFEGLMNKFENTTNQLGHRVYELLVMKELIEVAAKSSDIDELLGVLLEKVMAATRAQTGSVMRVDREQDKFRLVASRGLRSSPEINAILDIKGSPVEQVVRGRQTLLVEDIETDERTLRPSGSKYGSPSFLSMPIFIKENLVAVINLSRKEGHVFFDPNDEQIAAIMIGEIAFALENIKLHLEIQDHLNNLERRTLELEGANKLLTTEIDNRKQAEVALNKAYDELKQTQAQLIQSAKLSSIGELSAGVAHELNQPLMVIRGHAQMLLRQLTPEMDFYEEMELIERNTKRLMRIINHLRVFSRQSDTNFMAMDVNTVIENAFLMIAEQLRLKEIEIDQKLNPDIPEVRGDENQLEQVLLNLITNARDAIEQKKKSDGDTSTVFKKLSVETRYAESNGKYVEILVSDTGCGIPKEDAHKIFDPFFTTKDVGSGTGLGLSISYGIIQDHKGNIEVSETGPEGTTICIRLPVLSSVGI